MASIGDLAERWKVSRQRVQALERHPDFPDPLAIVARGRMKIYMVEEADAFRHRHAERNARRGKIAGRPIA